MGGMGAGAGKGGRRRWKLIIRLFYYTIKLKRNLILIFFSYI